MTRFDLEKLKRNFGRSRDDLVPGVELGCQTGYFIARGEKDALGKLFNSDCYMRGGHRYHPLSCHAMPTPSSPRDGRQGEAELAPVGWCAVSACFPCRIPIMISKTSKVRLGMTTQQLLLRLPEDLVRRFKRAVAPRERSKFVQRLLEQALPPDEVSDSDPLYRAALAVEQDETLAAEMAEWETATIDDGLPSGASRDRSR